MELKVAVVGGCGAAGSVFSAALLRSGADVTIIDRAATACSSVNLVVENYWSGKARVCGWGSARGPFDVVVMFTKVYDLDSAMAGVPLLSPGIVISPHNGLGGLEMVEKAYGSRAAGMIVYYGASRESRCRTRYNGGSRVILGCRTNCRLDILRALAEHLTAGGLEADVVDSREFNSQRWLKLAVNSAINPVTALSWSTNGVIVDDENAKSLATDLASETGRVARGLSIELPEDPVEATLRTAYETRSNCSSTVQDLASGRPTELRYINMAIWEASVKTYAPALVNLATYRAVEVASRWLKGRRSPCERS